MKPRKMFTGVLATAALAVLAAPALAQGGMDAPSEAIVKLRTTYIEALNNKDPKTIANLYADDAQYMGVDGVLYAGRDAIAKVMNEEASTWGHFVNKPGELMVEGNMAWEMGHGLQHITSEDGSMMELKSQYLVVLALVDGTWKIKALSVGMPPEMPGM